LFIFQWPFIFWIQLIFILMTESLFLLWLFLVFDWLFFCWSAVQKWFFFNDCCDWTLTFPMQNFKKHLSHLFKWILKLILSNISSVKKK
jgi:hypothetical protein